MKKIFYFIATIAIAVFTACSGQINSANSDSDSIVYTDTVDSVITVADSATVIPDSL